MDTVRFLNIDIQAITQEELLRDLKKGVLVTPNLDHLMKLQKDREFYDIYQQAEWVICDSTILYYSSKFLKKVSIFLCRKQKISLIMLRAS